MLTTLFRALNLRRSRFAVRNGYAPSPLSFFSHARQCATNPRGSRFGVRKLAFAFKYANAAVRPQSNPAGSNASKYHLRFGSVSQAYARLLVDCAALGYSKAKASFRTPKRGKPRRRIRLLIAGVWSLGLFGFLLLSVPASAQQPRRDAIFVRRGYIKIGLGTQSRLTVQAPGGLSITGSSGQSQTVQGSVTASAWGGNVALSAIAAGLANSSTVSVAARAGGAVTTSMGTYRGKIVLTARGGSLRCINELLIDDWLKGVLPAEIGADSPPEALKAQAVVGRSEAIYRLLKPPHAEEGYDFCTGVHCQAYKGTKGETDQVIRACDDTNGVVLLAAGDVLNGVYHNVCGGTTSSAEEVWDSEPLPGLRPVFDTARGGRPDLSTDAAASAFIMRPPAGIFCDDDNPGVANYAKKYFRWSKSFDASQLSRITGISGVRSVEVVDRRASGRVRKLRITGSGASKTIEKELPIRNMFDLWSGLFVVEQEYGAGGALSKVTFHGAGNGHGVGLCQHGAREAARRGATYLQLLKHYYPEATIQRIYRP